MSEKQVSQIIDDAYPPGSEKRLRLDAAAEDAMRLLIEHGYGYLLEQQDERQQHEETPAVSVQAGLATAQGSGSAETEPDNEENED